MIFRSLATHLLDIQALRGRVLCHVSHIDMVLIVDLGLI